VTTLELLTAFAPQHVREAAFRIAFPDENKATFLLAKLLAKEAETTLDIDKSRYRSLVDTGDSNSTVLARDDTFKALLREAGSDLMMQSVQDSIFASETWDPAQRWFSENGFTLPLSMLVISDSFLQSGSMLWFLRRRFKEVPPAKGGREKAFVSDYTNHRHLWLSGSGNRAIHNSAYRTRCYLAQINSENWNLDSLPIVMNGVRVA
jgi:hypothetical protein